MGKTIPKLPLTSETLDSVREQLEEGFGLFSDGPFTYVVLDARTHRFEVVRRESDETFTQRLSRLGGAVRVAMNGPMYGGSWLYARTTTRGPLPRDEVFNEGNARMSGNLLKEDEGAGRFRYFLGRNRDRPYLHQVKLDNPPDTVHEGIGGLGPIIITRDFHDTPLAVGVGNLYATTGLPPDKIPTTREEWADCTQRHSNHFEIFHAKDNDTDFCAFAADDRRELLLFIVKPGREDDGLVLLRDKLGAAGVTCACFTDGDFLATPREHKDKSIEFGLMGARTGLAAARLRVTLAEIEVLDPCVVEGDEGRWEIGVFVNGRRLGEELRTIVAAGDYVALERSVAVDIDPNRGEDLVIELRMRNLIGPTLSGLEPPPVPSFRETLSYRSEPPWGVGTFSYVRAEVYRLRYSIEARE